VVQKVTLPMQGMMSKVEAAGAASPLLGDLLIVGAQVLQATQFILEEKYLWQVLPLCSPPSLFLFDMMFGTKYRAHAYEMSPLHPGR